MRIFDLIRRLFRMTPTPQTSLQTSARPTICLDPHSDNCVTDPAWCVAANIILERSCGPGGVEKRRGTKHFAPGAKVYVYDVFWGMGGQTVSVIGRHRRSKRFIQLHMASKNLANWRTELVYSPTVAKLIRKGYEFGSLDAGSDRARIRAEEIVEGFIRKGAPTQPFITRPPKED